MVVFSIFSFAAQAQTSGFPFFQQVHAYVTGYNTVPEQTSPTPCIAASGGNICGRTDVVACPRRFSLGTYLQIRGATYVCEDRLARKYDSRFDISCDKDFDCPFQVTGWVDIKVFSPPTPANAAPMALASAAPTAARTALRSAAGVAVRTVAVMEQRRMFVPVRHVAVLRGHVFRRA